MFAQRWSGRGSTKCGFQSRRDVASTPGVGDVAEQRSERGIAMCRWLGIAAAMFITACAVSTGAASAAGITFIAPPGARSYPDQSLGPAGYTEAPTAVRTTDPQPSIGIQADAAGQLQCHFDSVFVTQPCGGPTSGCPAAACGSFQPSSPLGPDSEQFSRSHFLAVDLVDANGDSMASVWLNIDFDTTPPTTGVDEAGGILTEQHSTLTPLRPTFTYHVSDSNSVGSNIDTAACSWTPSAKPPTFRPCGLSSASSSVSFSPGRLARVHRLYRLVVRGTDDFGRSTTASGVYDPIPCVLSIRRPGRIASLVSSGVQTHLRCEAIRRVSVALYAFMVNGQQSATPRGAVSDNPILGEYNISRRAGTFSLARRLRLFGAAASAARHARSIGIVLAAGDQDKITAGIADDSLSYQVLTLRH
jgi:hypothetical protein